MSGPLLSVSTMKKALLTAVTAVAWFLPGHLAILALLVLIWGSAMASTTNTAKMRGTEARLAAHITATAPAVNLVANGGTIGGSLTVSGNHTVTGNATSNGDTTVLGSLGVHTNTTLLGTLGAQGGSTLQNGVSVSGGLSSDTLQSSSSTTVLGAIGVHGNSTMLGTLSINGNAAMPNGSLGSASAPPTGGSAGSTIAGSQFCGSFFTGSGAATWAQDISNKVDAIISALSTNGVTN